MSVQEEGIPEGQVLITSFSQVILTKDPVSHINLLKIYTALPSSTKSKDRLSLSKLCSIQLRI